MKRNLLYCCVLFMVLLVSVPFSFGQSSDVLTLRGLQAIGVVVEGLTSEGRRTGLTSQQIKTEVELQLRKVGIRVDESVREFVYVNVNIVEAGDIDHFVYSLELSVEQPVTFERDSSSLVAITWTQGYVGIISQERARNTIRESIHYLVDIFINDYLAVNPITR